MYQDLSTCHDWPVKKATVNLSIMLKGNLKHISGNSLSLLVAQNKDISGASQTLLIGDRLHLCMMQARVRKNLFFWNVKLLLCDQSNKI